jgi:hypothetical protein
MTDPVSIGPLAAFLILVASGAVMTIVGDWHVALIALIGQYVAVGALLAAAPASSLMWTYVIVGGLAAVILYLGNRRRRGEPDHPVTGAAFRTVAFLLVALVATIAALRFPLPFVDAPTSLVCMWLAGLFVVQAALFQQPTRMAIAALSLLNALALYEQKAEGSLLLLFWAVAAQLLIGVAAGYLQFAWREGVREEEP